MNEQLLIFIVNKKGRNSLAARELSGTKKGKPDRTYHFYIRLNQAILFLL